LFLALVDSDRALIAEPGFHPDAPHRGRSGV